MSQLPESSPVAEESPDQQDGVAAEKDSASAAEASCSAGVVPVDTEPDEDEPDGDMKDNPEEGSRDDIYDNPMELETWLSANGDDDFHSVGESGSETVLLGQELVEDQEVIPEQEQVSFPMLNAAELCQVIGIVSESEGLLPDAKKL